MKGWRRVSNRDRLERDIDAELRFHVEQQVRELMLAGMTEPEARRKARMEFGGIDQIKEECRDARRFPLIDDLRQDLRYALRMIFNKPGFTLVAVLTLGLGIGANTAVFSIINAVLLRPVNAPDADRLVRFVTLYVGGSTPTQGVNDFRLLQQETTLYEKIAAHRMELANLTGAGDPEQVAAALVSADFLDLFGAPVLEGRTFTAEEDQPNAGHFAILSYEFWAGHFGKNVPLSGQVISINGKPHTVVGVLAPGFDTEQFPQRPDVWIPFQIDPYAAKVGGDLCVITGSLKATSALQI